MVGEERDELLADHAGRAENADGNHAISKKKADAANRVGR
jgi:hypothetical protein